MSFEAGQIIVMTRQSAAGGDNGFSSAAQLFCDLCFPIAKGRFALLIENFRNAFPGARGDDIIGIEKGETQNIRDDPADGRFAGAHEADQSEIANLPRSVHRYELADYLGIRTQFLKLRSTTVSGLPLT